MHPERDGQQASWQVKLQRTASEQSKGSDGGRHGTSESPISPEEGACRPRTRRRRRRCHPWRRLRGPPRWGRPVSSTAPACCGCTPPSPPPAPPCTPPHRPFCLNSAGFCWNSADPPRCNLLLVQELHQISQKQSCKAGKPPELTTWDQVSGKSGRRWTLSWLVAVARASAQGIGR